MKDPLKAIKKLNLILFILGLTIIGIGVYMLAHIQ